MQFFVDGRQRLGLFGCQQLMMPASQSSTSVVMPPMPLCPTPCRLQAATATMIVMVPTPIQMTPSIRSSACASTQVSSPCSSSVASDDTATESEETLSAIILRNKAQIIDPGVINPSSPRVPQSHDLSAFAKASSSNKITSPPAPSISKPFRCFWKGCGKSFHQLEPLKRHHRIHTGERPFLCDWPGCGKMFSQSTHRTVHMRSHTGERPYSCPICSRSFAHKSHVKRHAKVHNSASVKSISFKNDREIGEIQQGIKQRCSSP